MVLQLTESIQLQIAYVSTADRVCKAMKGIPGRWQVWSHLCRSTWRLPPPEPTGTSPCTAPPKKLLGNDSRTMVRAYDPLVHHHVLHTTYDTAWR